LTVFNCAFPTKVFAAILGGPNKSGGRVDPVAARLSLVARLVGRWRLSTDGGGHEKEENENGVRLSVHSARLRKDDMTILFQNQQVPAELRPSHIPEAAIEGDQHAILSDR
jgi:hypothetical protein